MVACPSVSVVSTPGFTVPLPAVTEKLTLAPGTARPLASVTLNVAGVATTLPTTPAVSAPTGVMVAGGPILSAFVDPPHAVAAARHTAAKDRTSGRREDM